MKLHRLALILLAICVASLGRSVTHAANVDLLRTMAALTGQTLQADEGPDSFDVLPALTGKPAKQIRDHLVLGASQPTHLALREGNWVFLGAKGGGGFGGRTPGEHLLGGPAALKFAGQTNSDVINGRFKKDAPAAQLYNLQSDRAQGMNLFNEEPDQAGRMRDRLQEIKAGKATRPASEPKARTETTASQRPPN